MSQDPRVAELEHFAREEDIVLPMSPDMIVYFAPKGLPMGCVVDLVTGQVYREVTIPLETSGKAVAHLLHGAVGEVAL